MTWGKRVRLDLGEGLIWNGVGGVLEWRREWTYQAFTCSMTCRREVVI